MLPYLHFLDRDIPMYGIFVSVGIFAVILYHSLTIKKRNFPEADAQLSIIYGGVGAVIGAKILWLSTVWPAFIADIPCLFTQTNVFLQKYVSGGYVFYGGLYGALAAVWLYCRTQNLSFWGLMRCLMPIVPLFHGFGRLGCFCMGCCYGCPSERFGISFSRSFVAPNGIPLLPVQLMEAGCEFLLFVVLAKMAQKHCSGKNMFCLWFFSYGLLRFVLEFFRADDYRVFFGVLSLSQIISIITVIFSAVVFLENRSRLHKLEVMETGEKE